MTIEEIQERIQNIRDQDGDDEEQHIIEDKLRADFIEYVAGLNDAELAEKAKLVLTTDQMSFSRWYA